MLRTARLAPLYFSFSLFARHDQYDKDLINQPSPNTPKTGWERVKKMYTSDEYGEPSVELNYIGQSTLAGSFIGACAGGFVRSKSAYIYFIENNQATIFKSTAQAKKKLQDYVTVAFAKGAYQWGWRVGIFTFLFSGVATTISVYRGDTSLLDYITAGAITGALYKINLGLAATLVGAGVGAVISAVFGAIIFGLLKITGFSMVDIRSAMYSLKVARENQLKEAEGKRSVDPLAVHHDQLVEAIGKKTIEDF